MTSSRRTRWRERWAQQEMERRRTAYRASLAQWRRRDTELRSLLAAATTTEPAAEGSWSAWLELAGGEAVYWTASDAALIEGEYVLRLRPPQYREFSRADEPAAGPPIDTGRIAITNQRVVFVGRAWREWPYSKLIGMAHTVAGETWLLVTTGQKVTGVAPPAAAVAEFRLQLALALADGAGERDAFVADLAGQVEHHEQAKPAPPAPATADQAPPPLRLGRRGRLLTAAAAGSAVLVSSLVVGAALRGGDQRPDAFPAATGSPAPSPSPVTTPERPTPGAESPEPGRGEPVRQAVPPQQLPPPPPPPPPPTTSPPPPEPSPSPSADPVDPRFASCDEANEHGYGPYFRDRDPEYHWYPDRNGNGVVCWP